MRSLHNPRPLLIPWFADIKRSISEIAAVYEKQRSSSCVSEKLLEPDLSGISIGFSSPPAKNSLAAQRTIEPSCQLGEYCRGITPVTTNSTNPLRGRRVRVPHFGKACKTWTVRRRCWICCVLSSSEQARIILNMIEEWIVRFVVDTKLA
jgi:hypothetical protein